MDKQDKLWYYESIKIRNFREGYSMNLSWLQSAMMGFVCGFSEPLPVSAEAHRSLLMQFFGVGAEGPLFRLACHGAVLIVILLNGQLELNRLRRTRKILKTPPRRRTAHPDMNSAGTLKLLRPAVLIAVLGRMLSVHLTAISEKLYLLMPMLIVCGVILWMPTQMRTANKDGRHLTPADGMLMGLGAALGAIPGISPVGASVCVGLMRGADRRYALRFSWIMLAVGLASALVLDIAALAGTGFELALAELLSALIGAIFAALGAYVGIWVMRSLIRRSAGGVCGFCYYNWGLALLCLVLFLMV